MVRRSKVERMRSVTRKRPSAPAVKTGPQKENIPHGFKHHENALTGERATLAFIPKIK